MSESQVPVYVDTRNAFLQQLEVSGFVALERLPRFQQGLANKDGSVEVDLQFTLNESNKQIISGKLKASVAVICQRCLEPTVIALSDDIKLALIRDESQAGNLDPELDPWICEDNRLELAGLVEEQLMLCMPIVSYHPDKSCQQALQYKNPESSSDSAEAGAGAENPFAVLKALKE